MVAEHARLAHRPLPMRRPALRKQRHRRPAPRLLRLRLRRLEERLHRFRKRHALAVAQFRIGLRIAIRIPANHGVLVTGRDVPQALLRLFLIEEHAAIYLDALAAGPPRVLSSLDMRQLDEVTGGRYKR